MNFPSKEQIAALKAFAAVHGRNWKSALRQAWETGDYVADRFNAEMKS